MKQRYLSQILAVARRSWRVSCFAFGALFVLYIGIYAINSYLGGYWLQPERDGIHRWNFGMSLHVAILWQPAWGYSSRYNSDFSGVLFSPLVALDRRWFHRTRYLTDQSTFDWLDHSARPSDIHPRWRPEFIEAKQKLDERNG